MATNFVAQNGDKLARNAFIICAGIFQQKVVKTYTRTENLDVSSTSCKNFVNFSAVNP